MIALFGTSADPPTMGHQAILRWLGEHFDQVAVWASDNPFKAHQAPLEHRQEMLRRLIQETSSLKQNIAVYPELSDPKTLNTVQRARQRWPNVNFTFVIGSDLVPKLTQWYRIEVVLSQVQLLVIPRPGYPLEAQDLQQLQQKGTIAIADFTGPDMSSTAYRDQGNGFGLTPSVKAYIHQEGLYECLGVDASTHRPDTAVR